MTFLTYLCFANGKLSIRSCLYLKKKNVIILISVLDLTSGSEIEDFVAALKTQNIIPEITLKKNITSIPLHNGAIKVSLKGKVSDIIFFFIPVYQQDFLKWV